MLKKKLKTTRTILLIVCLALIASFVVIFLFKQKYDGAYNKNSQLTNQINKNTKTVYVATQDIAVGDHLVDGINVVQQEMLNGMDETLFATEDDLGYSALIEIPTGSAVQKNMVAQEEITDDERIVEINSVNLTTTQHSNDIVDIRILFPNGEDYILLSKQTIHNLNGVTFQLYLTEDEILTFNSAVVDAYNYGAKIYTTKYIASQIQQDAIPYYPVKQETLDLINSDPNIVEVASNTLNAQARQNLDERMALLSDGEITVADFSENLDVTSPSEDTAGNDADAVMQTASTEDTEEAEGIDDESTTTSASSETGVDSSASADTAATDDATDGTSSDISN